MGIEIRKLEARPLFVLALLILCVFLFYMYLRPGKGSLQVNVGESSIIVDITNDQVNIFDLLNELLAENEYHNEIIAILEKKYGLYKIDSNQLINLIRLEDPESKLSVSIRELLKDSRGPFVRPHSFYNIEDVKVVDAINALGYHHPVAAKFRELSGKQSGIFYNKGLKVNIRICDSNTISNDSAAVCKGSGFYKKYVMLQNPDDCTKIERVFADIEIPCYEEDDVKTLILLNAYNGAKLYNNCRIGADFSGFLWAFEEGYAAEPNEEGLVAVK